MILLGALVSVLLGVLAFRQVDIQDIWVGIKEINPLAFVLYFVIRVFNFVLPGLRSKILFTPLSTISLWELIKSVWLAFAVNNLIPLRAGEVARVAYLAKKAEVPTATVVTIVAFERMLDMVGLLLLVLFVAVFLGGDLPMGASSFAVAGTLSLVVLVLAVVAKYPDAFMRILKKTSGIFGRFVQSFALKCGSALTDGMKGLGSLKSFVAVFGLTMGFWGVAVVMVKMWIWAFGIETSWITPFLLVACLSFGTALPSAPGNIGVFHWVAIQSFLLVGIEAKTSTPYALVVHAMEVLPFTLLAIPFFYRDIIKMFKNRPQSE